MGILLILVFQWHVKLENLNKNVSGCFEYLRKPVKISLLNTSHKRTKRLGDDDDYNDNDEFNEN